MPRLVGGPYRLITLLVAMFAMGCETTSDPVGAQQSALITNHLLKPDDDGNIVAMLGEPNNLTVRAGDTVTFWDLEARDNIIEVGSPNITSARLCSNPELGVKAHPVPPQSPIAPGLYAHNEISGPHHTYAAGMYVLSVGTDKCRNREKTMPCVLPNEEQLAAFTNGGVTEYLCEVKPNLMNPRNPDKELVPPSPNPDCIRGETLDTTWSHPAVQGVFLRLAWKDINTAFEEYDWSALDHELTQAVRYGKTVTLGIRVGGNAIPEWAFETGDPDEGPVRRVQLRDWDTGGGNQPNEFCGFKYDVASPADPAFRTLFHRAINALGRHIREDQRRFSVIAGVKVTGLGMATLENRLPKRCAIAVRNLAAGDAEGEGHIVDIESSTDLGAGVVFDADYANARITRPDNCVCNPQVLEDAGYTPSVVRDFYEEVERTIHRNFGYKQLIFMNISDGFPQVGENHRFWGDHLVPRLSTGRVQSSVAEAPADIPDGNDITDWLIEDGRNAVFAQNSPRVARSFGVENAALKPIGFSENRNAGVKCTQQAPIAASGIFQGSAQFPIAASTNVELSIPENCPNQMAAQEGITHFKAGGFQVVKGLVSGTLIDESLWNLTLNTNGLFFEYYEQDHWISTKLESLHGVLGPYPAVRYETATPNHELAASKSLADWNQLLQLRAEVFSSDPDHQNDYQTDPFPSWYEVTIESAPSTTRFYFNSRACQAFYERGVPVRINSIRIVN